jgi:hypothetical protein
MSPSGTPLVLSLPQEDRRSSHSHNLSRPPSPPFEPPLSPWTEHTSKVLPSPRFDPPLSPLPPGTHPFPPPSCPRI